MSYGLNLGWGGPIGGIYRVSGGGQLRDILEILSRAHAHRDSIGCEMGITLVF